MKIILVGNAPVVTEMQKVIDDADLVCRFNDFNLNDNQHLIGSRTHYWITQHSRLKKDKLVPFDMSEIICIHVRCGWLKLPKGIEEDWKDYPHVEFMKNIYKLSQFDTIDILKNRDWDHPPTLGMYGIGLMLNRYREHMPLGLVGFGPREETLWGRLPQPRGKDRWHTPHPGKFHDFRAERVLINQLEDEGYLVRLENGVL